MLANETLTNEVSALLRKCLRTHIPAAQGQVFAKNTEVAGDVVTDTDYSVQNALKKGLLDLLPKSVFIGEEDFKAMHLSSDAPHWIVDPLDGTLNFACDLPFFGASIALIEDGHPTLGVIYDYGSDVLFTALSGAGAMVDGRRLRWNSNLADRSPVGISSGFLERMINRKDNSNFSPDWLGTRFRIFGSQAIQLCWAAGGRLKLNICVEAKLWDDAAGALICREAGADYEALNVAPLFPLTHNSIALAGKSLFSVSGSPDMVALCRRDFKEV